MAGSLLGSLLDCCSRHEHDSCGGDTRVVLVERDACTALHSALH